MTLIVSTTRRQYELPDEGTHHARVAQVKDLGSVPTAFGAKEKVLVVWETEQKDNQGMPRKVFQRFTKTLHIKSALRRALRSILGRDPGEQFDLESLVGMEAELLIQHHESDGAMYANVIAIMPPKGGRSSEPETARGDAPRTSGPAIAQCG